MTQQRRLAAILVADVPLAMGAVIQNASSPLVGYEQSYVILRTHSAPAGSAFEGSLVAMA